MALTVDVLVDTLQAQARLLDSNQPMEFEGPASLSLAKNKQIAFLFNTAQLPLLEQTQAGLIITVHSLEKFINNQSVLVVKNIFDACDKIEHLVSKSNINLLKVRPSAVIDPSAKIHPSTKMGSNVSIGPNCVIKQNVEIDDNCCIGANVVIGDAVKIGYKTNVYSYSTIESDTIIGNDVMIDAGVVIGCQPYAYLKNRGKWNLSVQYGRVLIGDMVTIGANTVIDKGVYSDTVINDGVKIDGLVKVAYGVVIGKHSAIAGCVAIGAMATIGEHCMLGGGSTISSNVSIANNIVITGMTTVNRDILKEGLYSSGTTAQPHKKWRQNAARFHHLNASIKKLKMLYKDFEEFRK